MSRAVSTADPRLARVFDLATERRERRPSAPPAPPLDETLLNETQRVLLHRMRLARRRLLTRSG